MKNVMIGNIGGEEVVGTNENGIGTVVCKLKDVPDIVEERDRLREMLESIVDLQERHYGCGMNTHLAMIDKSVEIKQLLNGETK